MRRGLALARDFARRRSAFGARLIDKPLHADTLAMLEAEYAGAFCLAFRSAALLGALEHGSTDPNDERLARALVPLAKLTTAKQAGRRHLRGDRSLWRRRLRRGHRLAAILADAQVLPIWEGTTNVLSLDTLRALGKGGALEAIATEVERCATAATDAGLAQPIAATRAALAHASSWVEQALPQPDRLEAGARRFALTLGRSLELALLCAHAQWSIDHGDGHGPRLAAAARRFAQNGVDQIGITMSLDDSRLLA